MIGRVGAIVVAAVVLLGCGASAQITDDQLRAAFAGGQVIDLRTSTMSSVVALRDKVGIPAPDTPVLLKTFDRDKLPNVLRPIFANPQRTGVTINGKYIAIIRTQLRDEYTDILRHELVHAYITLASPEPLPLWFQEGSAVHYSMGKDRKFYGQPAENEVGVMIGRTVELPEDYKQKLQTFNYVLEKSGEKQFNKWYKQAVMTGKVDPRPLLGLDPIDEASLPRPKGRMPMWLGVMVAAILMAVVIVAYISSKRTSDYY